MREFRPLGNTLFPPVVKNLLIINGIFFLATYVFQNSMGFDLTEHLALFYFASPKFRIWQLITHLFMHGSVGHIFSNMFALWMFGSILENFMGSKKFLNYYLLSGIGASILYMGVLFLQINPIQKHAEMYDAQPSISQFESFIQNDVSEGYRPDFNRVLTLWQQNPNSTEAVGASKNIVKEYLNIRLDSSVLGASGAVFGLLLAFGMFFPNTLIYIYFFIPMKAKYLVILYGLFELYNGVANNPGDNVAHFAHLGGMLIGFILIKVWDIKRPSQY
ncbi:MAG: rhomboid family intramembrane serine protease [Bacteroidetes bacterium]|nr:rhomboid family intramembrane serine protease [Bacteroidota bacterium]MBU1373520.1 rhomboid family intramembrane serine protease [Bacteroidota bacterium]MBU1485278.1 rhomboid family intramembrane serine protease [Bacteroidota bacterium]MBU1760161.1 rhomboid family intramembrane serine protease [Bacteroidota bacterium]MBU2046045.1 rhomboid family intramembrane serine protease [Bacteroidota bacterium]